MPPPLLTKPAIKPPGHLSIAQGLDGGMQSWHGSWRETYLLHTQRGYVAGSHKPLVVTGLYSDLLHQPWLCATMELLPEWLEADNVDRCGAVRRRP